MRDHYDGLMTKRYMFNLLLDLDDSTNIEALKKLIPREVAKSPKVEVVSLIGAEVRAPGRPAEVKGEILAFLVTQGKPRSALQISKKIMRVQSTLYKPLHELADAGSIQGVKDGRYNVMRWQITPDTEESDGPEVDPEACAEEYPGEVKGPKVYCRRRNRHKGKHKSHELEWE